MRFDRSLVLGFLCALGAWLPGCTDKCIRHSDCLAGELCGRGTCAPATRDGGADGGAPADLKAPPDLRAPVDLTAPVDLRTAQPADMKTTADL